MSSKIHGVKKRHKKKKIKNSNLMNETCINPELFDGMSNWLKLQKVGHFLSHQTKFLLEIIVCFVRFATFSCVQIFASCHFCLPINSSKVLDCVAKKDPDSAAQSEQKARPAKFSKKHQNKNRPNNRNTSVKKTQHQFDFEERKSAVMASDYESDREDEDEDLGPKLTKSVAMDCEMVGTGPDGKDSVLARVSIVNSYSDVIYDEFVKPTEKITDYRTEVSGVRAADLKNAKNLFDVQKDVQTIIEGRRVIGHDLKHDFKALFLSHPKSLLRDTARYAPFRVISNGRTPSLKRLAAELLDCKIQSEEHSSVEDAQVAMLLYLMHKKDWEKSLRRRRR